VLISIEKRKKLKRYMVESTLIDYIIILMLMKARSFGKLKKVKINYIIKE